jgi:hypothetical protein
MGRTTVLIILHGSKHSVLGASARRPILVYQAATSELELPRIHIPRTPVNKGKREGRSLMQSRGPLRHLLVGSRARGEHASGSPHPIGPASPEQHDASDNRQPGAALSRPQNLRERS